MIISKKTKISGLSISAYARQCVEFHEGHSEESPTNSGTTAPPTFPYNILTTQVENQKEQLTVKDQQIEKLQSAVDQSQQLQAMTKKDTKSSINN